MIISSLLILDPLSEIDLDLFISIYTDPEVMKNIGPAFSKDGTLQLFKNATVKNDKNLFYVIRNSQNKNPLGIIGLIRNQKHKLSLELGVMILKNYHCKGYAYKATNILMQHAFDHLNAQSIVVYCNRLNIAANKISKALGFIDKGIIREKKSKSKNIKWEITLEQFRKTHKRKPG